MSYPFFNGYHDPSIQQQGQQDGLNADSKSPASPSQFDAIAFNQQQQQMEAYQAAAAWQQINPLMMQMNTFQQLQHSPLSAVGSSYWNNDGLGYFPQAGLSSGLCNDDVSGRQESVSVKTLNGNLQLVNQHASDYIEPPLKHPSTSFSSNNSGDYLQTSTLQAHMNASSSPALNSSIPTGPSNPNKKRKICRHFVIGTCPFGDRCKFLHPGTPTPTKTSPLSSPSQFNPVLPPVTLLSDPVDKGKQKEDETFLMDLDNFLTDAGAAAPVTSTFQTATTANITEALPVASTSAVEDKAILLRKKLEAMKAAKMKQLASGSSAISSDTLPAFAPSVTGPITVAATAPLVPATDSPSASDPVNKSVRAPSQPSVMRLPQENWELTRRIKAHGSSSSSSPLDISSSPILPLAPPRSTASELDNRPPTQKTTLNTPIVISDSSSPRQSSVEYLSPSPTPPAHRATPPPAPISRSLLLLPLTSDPLTSILYSKYASHTSRTRLPDMELERCIYDRLALAAKNRASGISSISPVLTTSNILASPKKEFEVPRLDAPTTSSSLLSKAELSPAVGLSVPLVVDPFVSAPKVDQPVLLTQSVVKAPVVGTAEVDDPRRPANRTWTSLISGLFSYVFGLGRVPSSSSVVEVETVDVKKDDAVSVETEEGEMMEKNTPSAAGKSAGKTSLKEGIKNQSQEIPNSKWTADNSKQILEEEKTKKGNIPTGPKDNRKRGGGAYSKQKVSGGNNKKRQATDNGPSSVGRDSRYMDRDSDRVHKLPYSVSARSDSREGGSSSASSYRDRGRRGEYNNGNGGRAIYNDYDARYQHRSTARGDTWDQRALEDDYAHGRLGLSYDGVGYDDKSAGGGSSTGWPHPASDSSNTIGRGDQWAYAGGYPYMSSDRSERGGRGGYGHGRRGGY